MPETTWPNFAFSADSAWGRCYRDFLRQKYEHSNSPYTLANYRLILTRFFSSPPIKSPEMYTREDVIAFIHAPGMGKGRIGQSPSPGTRNGRLSVLNTFYQFAGGYSIIGEDGENRPLMNRMSPTSGLSQAQSPRSYRSISFADFEKLFSVIPPTPIGLKYRALYLTIFWTARRVREITELRWRDLEQTMIVEKDGTSRLAWQYHFRGKARKNIDDVAELPQPAYDALMAYLVASGRLAHMESDSPLFIADDYYLHFNSTFDRKKPISAAVVWHTLKKYARAAGIDPKTITTHSFRHASSQYRYASGESLLSISHLLRHKSVGTTSLYLQGLVASSDDGAKLLEEKFSRFSKQEH